MLRSPLFFISFFFSPSQPQPFSLTSPNPPSRPLAQNVLFPIIFPRSPGSRPSSELCPAADSTASSKRVFPLKKRLKQIGISKLWETQKWTILVNMTGLAKGAATSKAAKRWEALGRLGRGRARNVHPSIHPFQGSLPHLSYFFLPLHSDIDEVIWPSVQLYWRWINGFIYCSFSESFVIID